MTETPELQLSSVSLIDEQQKQNIIQQAENALQYFQFESLLQRFSSAVAASPESIALVYEDQQLSYSQLDGFANAISQQLYAGGLAVEDCVGLCFDRSIEMVVAVLAVLKAGMVYVPMDPAIPVQRMHFMAEDSGIKLLLTSPEKVTQLEDVAAQVSPMTLSELDWTCSNSVLSSWQLTPDSPAYVIYTSGSTGQPKGVLVSHGNMARLFSGADRLFEFSADDVWCLYHSYAFDFSVWEMWGALCYGARLVIVPYWISRSPQDFYALLSKQQVTILNQTPTAFKQLIDVDQHSDAKLIDLRYIIFGGETLEFKQLEPWFQAYADTPELINMYGITETTVHVTFKKIEPNEITNQCHLIGQPLPDLSVYILDQYGQLTAPGVPGELFVSGAGVCLGYINNPELTAKRFVRLAHLQSNNSLFYRSGDCGRYLDNGELEYLGRLDQQVQFHGFRIELGEIEQSLLVQAKVEQAVVLLRENEQEQQYLLAYYSTRTAQPLENAELRASLASLLPAYMIPGIFVHVAQFPLTANGKVNRHALPEPQIVQEQPASIAKTPQQQVLLETWQQLLPQTNIEINDDFFALGGDSIQAIRVVSLLRKQGYRIAVQDLFRYPTIEVLATQLQPIIEHKEFRSISGEFQLTPVQHWFFNQQNNTIHHFNQTALLESNSGSWHIPLIEQSWNQLLQHHEALRSCFEVNENGVQATILPADQLTVDVQTVSLMAESDIELAMLNHAAERQRSFNLGQAPLIRLVVYQCPGADRLLIVIHHLLIDGVSWRIVLEDFSALYAAFNAGDTYALPEQTDSYADWAEGLSGFSQQQSLLTELPHWKSQVEQTSDCSWKAIDCCYQDAKSIQIQLNVEDTQRLLQQANIAYNTTIEDLLLVALVPTFDSWAGLTRFVLLMEGHGRESVISELDISRTVGWFTSLFPLVLEKVIGRGLGYQIKTVKEQLRQLPNKGFGYGVLRYLTPTELLSGHSLEFNPDLVFNYLGRFDDRDQSGVFHTLKNDVG
ncbi:MAG: amino acid adenylation domain-containing protein, partial [Gammaproteobacteria bacterium]|nr:amino acid adenylation domain-containing protein [Gammaproteobacteria bacterium]